MTRPLPEANGFTDANAANADDIGQGHQQAGQDGVEKSRQSARSSPPYLAAQKAIKAVVDKATEPIDAETGRLKAMLAEFAENERRRLAEEAKRLLARLAAEAEEGRAPPRRSFSAVPSPSPTSSSKHPRRPRPSSTACGCQRPSRLICWTMPSSP